MTAHKVILHLTTMLVNPNLPGALIENGRLGEVESVIGAFGTIMSALRGEIVCEVTTAKVRPEGTG